MAPYGGALYMEPVKRKKCCHCGKLFIPDSRKKIRQKYCCKPECRKASKAASQRKWLSKPENQDYFRGPENVQRVRDWRSRNPGYWRKNRKDTRALQDLLTAQVSENNKNSPQMANHALQDLLIGQPAVLIGLIAQFTGIALQDDIGICLLRLQQLGLDILNGSTPNKGEKDDCKIGNFTHQSAQSTKKLQLDRPPSGP